MPMSIIGNRVKQAKASDQTVRKPNKLLKRCANRLLRYEGKRISEESDELARIPSKIDRFELRKRSGRCPVCTGRLIKNSKRTRYERCCRHCNAVMQKTLICNRCGTYRVWSGRRGTFCKGCGRELKKCV
jgi:uncharacterized protein with PIN domain